MKNLLLYLYRWTMWNLVSRLFVRCYLWPRYHFTKLKDSDPLPKPPFVIISNHGTFFDPWIIGCFSRYPLAIMCNDEAFTRGAVSRWYLKSIGAFPKRKGAPDFRAMRKTMSLLSAGYPVCIFPEGQTSWDGRTQLIYKGIEKIVRRSGANLVLTRVTGNFLTKPWWADFIRKGRIAVTYKTMNPVQVAAMSDEALFDLMKSSMWHNDIKDPSNSAARFSGTRLAEGLERFVWMCMECGAEDTLVTRGNDIRCTSCGGGWSLDAVCKLTPVESGTKCFADLYDWAQWHRQRVIDVIKSATAESVLTESADVSLSAGDDNVRFEAEGRGTLLLTPASLTFSFEQTSRPALVFEVPRIQAVVIQKKDIVEFSYRGRYYRCLFNRHSPMKWIYYLRYLQGYEECEKRGFLG